MTFPDTQVDAAGTSPGGTTNTPMTCSRLKDWVRDAQPGARLILGHGSIAAWAYSDEVRDLVNLLAERGWLTPHCLKLGPGTAVRIVQRCARRMLKGELL